MKFAKQLDENAVPEWKEKYLNYKQAKKRLKAAVRAIRNIEQSPLQSDQRPSPRMSSLRDAPVYSFLNRAGNRLANGASPQGNSPLSLMRSRSERAIPSWRRNSELERGERVSPTATQVNERSSLKGSDDANARPGMTRYGSIIGSPPEGTSPTMEGLTQQRTQASLLELPDPALDASAGKHRLSQREADPQHDHPVNSVSTQQPNGQSQALATAKIVQNGDADEAQRGTDQPSALHAGSKLRSIFKPRRTNTTLSENRPALLQRMFSSTASAGAGNNSFRDNVALEAYRDVDSKKAEFFNFLESELGKIEDFYKMKEDEAAERLTVLREQLHIMRQQRLEELEAAEGQKRKQSDSNGDTVNKSAEPDKQNPESQLPAQEQQHKWGGSVLSQMDKAVTPHVGKTSQAMRDLGTPSLRFDPEHHDTDPGRDYTRRRDRTRKPENDVRYGTAKRKLKIALAEYYRSLELLKSYALLNNTAFRKIAKKCDKTLADMPGQDFMTKKINRARFLNSGLTDQFME